MKKIIGIYHKNCIDGTTAAAIVLHKFPTAHLFPLSHDYTPEDMEPILAIADADTECYTVDCGLGVSELIAAGCTVTTIDHHISMRETLENIAREHSNFTFIFDNNKSGASLTWAVLFPDSEQPDIVRFVEDSDLWKWEFGDDTRFVNSYLSMFRDDPATVRELMCGDLSVIKSKGEVISLYADKEVTEQNTRSPISIRIGEYMVPAYNITSYQSASGNMLSEQTNSVVAMFTINGDSVGMSFRSKEHHSPSSLELATLLGGGGHKNAAGARIPLPEFLKLIILEDSSTV